MLWSACIAGNLNLIRLFARHGVDINNQNDNGATALMYAASHGKTGIVQLLMELGAKKDLVTLDDFSALDVCADRETFKLLRSWSAEPAVNQATLY